MREVNWNLFRTKFNGKESKAFESLCYLLFCHEFGFSTTGIFRFKNQPGLETEPIAVDGTWVGFQSKFFDKNIDRKDIEDSILTTKKQYPNVTKIHIYVNLEFSKSSRIGKEPKYKTLIEDFAKSNNIEIEWRVPSHIEAQVALSENKALADYFFSLADNDVTLTTAKGVSETVQFVLRVAAGISALLSLIQGKPWHFVVAVVVVLSTFAWDLFQRRLRHRCPRLDPAIKVAKRAYLRGLLPFEQGERLLGRERDLARIVTKLGSSDFRFGYISGEAGVGKTSLLRATVIPEIRRLGWVVVYVSKLGSSPLQNLLKAARVALQLPDALNEHSLHNTISRYTTRFPNKRILIICDQFEEFLSSNTTHRERESLIKELGECLADQTLSTGVLISLRKEFVDDLQEFEPYISQPLDPRFCYRLRNWESVEALSVLQTAANYDHVPFAENLIRAIIRDLERTGEVRPVELQLVATQLIDERIYDVDRYKVHNGARGLLASFIKQKIEPNGDNTPEAERQIARHLLRSLCSKGTDVKRPQGLTIDELAHHIQATLAANEQSSLITSAENFDRILTIILHRFIESYIVVLEDEQTYNLAHDYIVRSILDATSEIDSVEEQANRLLDQYLDDQRRKPNILIPFRHFRFITKYATAKRKEDEPAAQLITRTGRHQALRIVAVAIAIPIVLTVLIRPKYEFSVQTVFVSHTKWVISEDHRLAVSLTRNGESSLWQLDQPWNNRTVLDVRFMDIIISPRATYLAGITDEGKIYIWRPQDNLSRSSTPHLTIARQRPAFWTVVSDYKWAGFSPDDKWIYIKDRRSVYLLRPNEQSWEKPKAFFESKGVDEISFSATGKYLYMFKSNELSDKGENKATNSGTNGPDSSLESKSVFISSLEPELSIPVKLDKELSEKSGTHVFSSCDDSWIAFTANDTNLYLCDLSRFPALDSALLLKKDRGTGGAYKVFFSPDNKWVVARAHNERFYTWRLSEFARASAAPAFQNESFSGYQISGYQDWTKVDMDADVVFTPDSKWIVGTEENGLVFTWPLDKSSAADAQLVGYRQNARGLKRLISDLTISPDGTSIAATFLDGTVYAWQLGTTPSMDDPSTVHGGSIPNTEEVSVKWFLDSKRLLSYGGADVYWGNVGEKFELLSREPSRVIDVANSPSKKALIVFADNGFSVIETKFYFWGVPIYSRPFPKLAHETDCVRPL